MRNKIGIVLWLLLPVLALSLTMFIFCKGVSQDRDRPEQADENGICQHQESFASTAEVAQAFQIPGEPVGDDMVLPHVPMPRRAPASAEELELVKLAYVAITKAYVQNDVETFREIIANIPETVTTIYDLEFNEITRPFVEEVNRRFLQNKMLLDFTRIEDFDRYADVNICAVRFIGEIQVKRCLWTGLSRLDKLTLRQFNRYRENFRTKNNVEYESHAEKYYQEWVGRIESDDGFTRIVAFLHVDIQWPQVIEGKITRSNVFEYAMATALQGLMKEGVCPKWIEDLKKYCETKEIPIH